MSENQSPLPHATREGERSHPQEVELKLIIPDNARLRAERALEDLLGGCSSRQWLETVYYDTPDQLLRRQRVALRVRREGERWIQTLKGGGGVKGGLHTRDEWNWEIPSRELQLSCFREAGWGDGLSFEALTPVFSTVFERRVWWLRQPGTAIEVALDEGEVCFGDHRVPFIEVELELKEGCAAALFELAEHFATRVPCWPGFVSKAARGYGLCNATGLASSEEGGKSVTAEKSLVTEDARQNASVRQPPVPRSVDEALRKLSAYLDRALASAPSAIATGSASILETEAGNGSESESESQAGPEAGSGTASRVTENDAVRTQLRWQDYLLHLTWLRAYLDDDARSLHEALCLEMRNVLDWLSRHRDSPFADYLRGSLAAGILGLKIARTRL